MKNLFATLIALSSLSAFAQSNQPRSQLIIPADKVDTILTQSNGYVSKEEINARIIKVPGTILRNGNFIIDLTNPKLDVTEIILNSGASQDVRKIEGGDMGGGGSRIVR